MSRSGEWLPYEAPASRDNDESIALIHTLRSHDAWHSRYRATDGRGHRPGGALLVGCGAYQARRHSTEGAITRQARVNVDDHIAMRRLGLLNQQLDTLRDIMAVFQIPVARQSQVKIDVVARS